MRTGVAENCGIAVECKVRITEAVSAREDGYREAERIYVRKRPEMLPQSLRHLLSALLFPTCTESGNEAREILLGNGHIVWSVGESPTFVCQRQVDNIRSEIHMCRARKLDVMSEYCRIESCEARAEDVPALLVESSLSFLLQEWINYLENVLPC